MMNSAGGSRSLESCSHANGIGRRLTRTGSPASLALDNRGKRSFIKAFAFSLPLS